MGVVEKTNLGDRFVALVKRYAEDDDYKVCLRYSNETKLKEKFVAAVNKHKRRMERRLASDGGVLDSHKVATAICMASLDVRALRDKKHKEGKSPEYFLSNEMVAMLMGRSHLKANLEAIDDDKHYDIFSCSYPLKYDERFYDTNFLYMLSNARCAVRFCGDGFYQALSKLFYHFECDWLNDKK